MQEPELSVIIPVMNIENRICDVLNTLKEDTKDISVEFLIIDRGSKDKTMQMALRFLRQNQLNGYIMQESGGNVSQVLNAGIQYANGTYITFVFPQRIYQSYLEEFLKKAKETNAEFLFGCKRQEQLKFADLRSTSSVIKQLTGVDYVECMITHSMIPDAGAVVVSNQFLQNHKIWFNENNTCRYGEDFVYKCFLAANHLAQVAVVMQVDDEKSVLQNQNHTSQDIFAPFEEVEGLLRTLVFLQKQYSHHEKMIKLFMQQKIPETVMQIIEGLLKQKVKPRAIRSYMHKKGYDRLLIIGPYTPHTLKVKITTWRYFPRFYRFV